MKCSIIRDLLPLYEEGLCSEGTCNIVKKHLEHCEECREIYNIMKKALKIKTSQLNDFDEESKIEKSNNFKNNVEKIHNCNSERDFWCRYYGRLYIKGIAIFLMVYFIMVISGMIISKFLK